MSPELELLLSGNLKEVSEKNAEIIRNEALSQGISQGESQGDNDARRDIAKNLKGVLSDEEIARHTRLSVSIVRQL